MAFLHHKWGNGLHYLKHLPSRVGRLTRQLRGRMQALLHHGLSRLRPRKQRPERVTGLRPDNWLEPTCHVLLGGQACATACRLAGVAPVDTELTVRLDGAVLERYRLAGGPAAVRLDLPARSKGELVLEFSGQVRGPEGDAVSFLVEETDLFSEADLG
jgi:hypothetical protein